ncbi:S8 family peptidase [Flavobacterium sp.]|uniref:S8 family peptidase n=1 Tax=Flavobacterium sp. TaxID=239 RepID=UPI0037519439
MKIIKILSISLLLGVSLNSCQDDKSEQGVVESLVQPAELTGNVIPGNYIVMFKDSKMQTINSKMSDRKFESRLDKSQSYKAVEGQSKTQINSMLTESRFDKSKITNYYTTNFNGISLKDISVEELKEISKNPNVKAIYFDQLIPNPIDSVTFSENSGSTNRFDEQVLPCGIANAGNFADGVNQNLWIWIIDSGVNTAHPDLNVITDSRYAVSFIGNSVEDCNGHGTHVAGTAGAKNNDIGVVGVSAGAPIVPVRVFDCTGGTSSSTILAAINHVAANSVAGDVLNMSLGGGFGPNCDANSPYSVALVGLGNSGTRIALAAGNSASNAAEFAPACTNGNNIFTVASMTCNETFSSFSNYNVDIIATGSSVYSTWLNGGYATLSGTSMASPHVAGIMHARNDSPATFGSVTGIDGQDIPIAVR